MGKAYGLTLTASNADSQTTQPFTLTVDQAPAITNANSTIFVVNQANTFLVTTTGFPNPAISTTTSLPTWA